MHQDETRTAIVAAARTWLGTPYCHQASLKGVGCDCLGLIRGVWREIYGTEPESPPAYAPDWAEAARGEPLAEAASRYLARLGDFGEINGRFDPAALAGGIGGQGCRHRLGT